MARTNVPLSALVANAALTQPAGTNVDPTNGHVIAANGLAQRIILRVDNTTVSGKAVTIKAGAKPPAMLATLGDIVVTVPASTVQFIGPLTPDRVNQADGSINIDIAAGMTGTITALQIPGGI